MPFNTFLFTCTFKSIKGEIKDINALRQSLVNNGYLQVAQVLEHGEFAVRGSILDIFPMGSDEPFRIDFFDDEVDSIRTFDVETQRSLNEIKEEDEILIGKIHIAITKIAKELGIDKDGYRVINNCGKDAGQTVMHLHFHIVAGVNMGEKLI